MLVSCRNVLGWQAEQLKKANYATSVSGKWHAGGHFDAQLPSRRGFDAALTFLNGNEVRPCQL